MLDINKTRLDNFFPATGLQASPRLTADFLDAFMGVTLADNPAKYKATHHWLSDFNGLCLKNMFHYSQTQEKFWASFGVPHEIFTAWLKPLVKATHEAVAHGHNPDMAARDNLRIEATYAARLRKLLIALTSEVPSSDSEKEANCDYLNRRGYKLVFDRSQCNWACETTAGQAWLLGQLTRLRTLEWQYHSYGQTRLRAMKKLLRSLLQVIANEPLSDLKRNPYRKPSPEGAPQQSDAAYLEDCELRLLALLAHDAIDIRRFALESPHAQLGACNWETVPGSEVYSVQLRYYPRPEGVASNGKTLYMVSPMINRCEIFDLAPGKSVVEGMLNLGYDLYMVDYGNPGPDQSQLGLSFYGKTIHDRYLELITAQHPGQPIDVMAYCMGGTLFMPYLARRIEEAEHGSKDIFIRQVALMTAPILFDDEESGHKPMRDLIRESYDPAIIQTFFGQSNVAPQTVEAGMHAIQPGVAFNVAEGFYARANFPGAIDDAAPFLHWLNSGTRFPAKAHQEWIQGIFMNNNIWEGRYTLPSSVQKLDGQPVDMDALNRADIAIFDYCGQRDPIAPVGSCKTSERWGRRDNLQMTCSGLNRTLEKNIGHIFVVSKKLLGEYLETVSDFLRDEPPAYTPYQPKSKPAAQSESKPATQSEPKPAAQPEPKPAAQSEPKPAARKTSAGRKPANKKPAPSKKATNQPKSDSPDGEASS